MRISSPAFTHGEMMPKKYTCQGENINPELVIDDIPKGTVALALIMDDPDAPLGTWDHWILFNMQITNKIAENSVPKGGVEGLNSWRNNKYGGPCPPSGTHRYFFKLYAVNNFLNLTGKATKADVEKAMQSHVLAKAELMGTYRKQ